MGLWDSWEFDQHEQVCFFCDPASGLRAIVAIHSTALGSAVGGTRFFPYANDQLGLNDALRLSRAMSYKCALAGLPCGGGKAVIIGDPRTIKNRGLLHAYGRFVNRIGSTFATGEDVGMSMADIETVREVSPFVGGTSKGGAGDPSIHTATGVMHGLRAVIEHQFKRDNFNGMTVAVQGLGAVGWRLAQLLHEAGVTLTVADVRADVVARAVQEFGATAVDSRIVHEAPVDIFAPCALGGVISVETVPHIRARAVAGAANNQLATPEAGQALAARGILFAPDYVINAGGVLSGLEELLKMPGRSGVVDAPLQMRLARIHDRLAQIFARSAAEQTAPEAAAERLAREVIRR